MITVTITDKDLAKHGACSGGRAYFRRLASKQGRKHTVRMEWTTDNALDLQRRVPGYFAWLVECDLVPPIPVRHADLHGRHLQNVCLTGLDCSSANFEGAKLGNANFIRANVVCAEFTKADLAGAYFIEANCTYASFTGADLHNASFRGARLYSANFTNANTDGADFTGARMHSWQTPPSGWAHGPNETLVRTSVTTCDDD